jgi:hypothetical protein
VWYPTGIGGRNSKFGGGGRNVDKGRVGVVGILLGGWIDIGGLYISLNSAYSTIELTKLESFT